jgi:sigma54-dependent transcription regulator
MPNGFLRDAQGNLLIKDGAFVVGEITLQHQAILLKMMPGDSKQYPTTGVGLTQFILDDVGAGEIKKKIRKEFEDDGMQIKSIKSSGDLVTSVDAFYK